MNAFLNTTTTNFCEIIKLFAENWSNKGRWKTINIVTGVTVKINKMEIISVSSCVLSTSLKHTIHNTNTYIHVQQPGSNPH